ncbi:CapA family protein [Embleya sp. NBC_00888]|uniref:CapA family protein n=1 Tax=Embleya sp. NBC_00888 TaxID=2975960 RepID=UPI003868BCB2|nr:CapA family protein [Embleya sp. NBC_00888]
MSIPRRRTVALGLVPLLIAGLASCGLLSDSGDSSGKTKNASDADPVVGRPYPSAAPGTGSAPPPATAAPGTEITVALAGDVHFFERTQSRLNAGTEGALGPIGKTLAAADLAMVNLESAITERGTPENKTYHFRAPAKALTELHSTGIDVVSMANNHAVDYGKAGLEDSIAAARNPPIGVVGIGKDAEQAYRPFVKNVKGVKVAFLAASQVQDITNQLYQAGNAKPGIATALQTDRLVRAVREAKAQADVVIVYMHWGIEGDKCPSADQKSVTRKLADAGAAAVLGTHAHVMQGAGWLGDTYVGYGYGNFLWYGTSPYPNSDDTGVATLTIKDGKVVGEKFTPGSIDKRGVPMPVTGAESKRILDRRETLRSCTGLTAAPKK